MVKYCLVRQGYGNAAVRSCGVEYCTGVALLCAATVW
jgi:hypothetical protein